jgi:hypothetical protein
MSWSLEITCFSWKFDFTLQRQSLWSGRCSEHMFPGGYVRSCIELMSHSCRDSSLISNNTKQVIDLSVCKLRTTSNWKLKQSENNEAVKFCKPKRSEFPRNQDTWLTEAFLCMSSKSAITNSGSSSRSVQRQNIFLSEFKLWIVTCIFQNSAGHSSRAV